MKIQLGFMFLTAALVRSEEIKDSSNPLINQLVQNFERITNHDDANLRSERSVTESSCPSASSYVNVPLGEEDRDIICNCSLSQSQAQTNWIDFACNPITNSKLFIVKNETLGVLKNPSRNLSENVVYCTNNLNCTIKFTIMEKDKIPRAFLPLQGFIMFLAIATVIAILCFVYKQCRYQIFLSCRDSCASSDINDGREFDAYISVGKSVSDIKFAERNIVDVLQMKYNYKVLVDDDNLLPRLDYSEKVQTKMYLSRRLIVVFTPAYMTNEWCMYCFSEGLRKLLELKIEMLFIVTDVTIQRELNALSSLVGHVPKLFLSTVPAMQTKEDKERILQKLRLFMPAAHRRSSSGKGMKAPMLGNAEEIDQRSIRDGDSYGGTKYTFAGNKELNMDSLGLAQQEMEYDEEDPASIKVNQYKAKKDFFRITSTADDDDNLA